MIVLIDRVDNENFYLPSLGDPERELIDTYPKNVLDLLYEIHLRRCEPVALSSGGNNSQS